MSRPRRIYSLGSVSVVKKGDTDLRQPSAVPVARSIVSDGKSPRPVPREAALPNDARVAKPVSRHPVCCVGGTLDHDDLYRDVSDALLAGGHGLTPREAQVCASITLGGNVLDISRTLGISAHTVATHRKRAYFKLGICSQNQLFAFYFEAIGLLSSSVHESINNSAASVGSNSWSQDVSDLDASPNVRSLSGIRRIRAGRNRTRQHEI